MNDRPRNAYSGRPDHSTLPLELESALDSSPAARERFEALAPSHRREYVRWILDARRPDARERRAAQTVMRLLAPVRVAETGTSDAHDAATTPDVTRPDAGVERDDAR